MVPPQLNSRLGFINPRLTLLYLIGVVEVTIGYTPWYFKRHVGICWYITFFYTMVFSSTKFQLADLPFLGDENRRRRRGREDAKHVNGQERHGQGDARSYGHLPVISGYFYGIIHSINGVISVLITDKWP